MVPGVPRTPTTPERVRAAACWAPGSMTPTTGMLRLERNAGRATAEAVLQATTRSFTSSEVRKAAFNCA
jgi:hypothetical protein